MAFDSFDGLRAWDGSDWSRTRFTRQQRQTLFREMAMAEMRRGPMTRRRWRNLVQYAAMLDLSAVEAGELVGEARESVGVAGIEAYLQPIDIDRRRRRRQETWSLWSVIAITAAVMAILDASFLHILF
jgi:hypothetical protein